MTVVYDKQANLADPREINLCFYTNPTSLAIVGYRTTVDPATVSEKLNPGSPPAQIQIAEIDGNILGAWAENYGTGTDDAKVWHKADMPASAPAPIIVYDRTPLGDDEDPDDDEHKRHVTDITGEKGHVMHLMFAGADTPSGFTLESGSGSEFNNVFPVGASQGLSANSDTPVYDVSLVSCGISLPKSVYNSDSWQIMGQHIHSLDAINKQGVSESSVPPYHMLKCIRSNSIKAVIPKDAIIIFDGDIPSGFTRYSAADDKYIRTGATVGETGGASTRRILVQAWTDAINRFGYQAYPASGGYSTATIHYHYFEAYTGAINNDPPYINVVLAKADDTFNYIPAGSIIMFDHVPPAADWDVVNFDGKLLIGKNTYGGTGGTAKRTPANAIANCNAEGQYEGYRTWSGSDVCKYTHSHEMEISVGEISTYPKCRPVIFAKAKHDIMEDGPEACVIKHDVVLGTYWSSVPYYSLLSYAGRHVTIANNGSSVGSLHCCYFNGTTELAYHAESTDGGKTWTVEQLDASWAGPQETPSMVIDKNGALHFVWAERGASGSRKIKYRKKTAAGSWGSVETVSTAGNDYYQDLPCIQVKNDGVTIGVCWTGQGWGTSASYNDVAYRERAENGTWDATITEITADANSGNYGSSSLDYDDSDYPHIVYNYVTSTTTNVYYKYKKAAGWQAQEQVNSDDNNKAGWQSNVLINGTALRVAYTLFDTIDSPKSIVLKQKTIGAAWGAKESVATAAGDDKYTQPQIQVDKDDNIYCCYSKYSDAESGALYKWYRAAYKQRVSGVWGSEQSIVSEVGRNTVGVQMCWSRMPVSSGIWQSMTQQDIMFIYISTPRTYPFIAQIHFHPLSTTVAGTIETEPTIETFNTKRRGAICLSKINGALASPALIS